MPGSTFRVILAIATLIRLLLVIAVPHGGTVSHRLQGLNDEQAHVNVIAHLAEHRSFPVQTRHAQEPGAIERADFEYYQPPFFYLLCAPLYAALPWPLALYGCRVLSVLCGLASLFVLWQILVRMGCSLPCRERAVLFLALLPTHAYFSALVSNDSITWLIGLVLVERLFALYDAARSSDKAVRRLGIHVQIGAFLALGMLSKSSMALFYPAVAFAYGLAYLRARDRAVLGYGLIALAISVMIAGPWYARNVAVYGSPLPLEVGFGPPSEGSIAERLIHTVRASARYFWFPMQHVPRSDGVSVLRAFGGAVLMAHAAAAGWYLVGGRRMNLHTRTLLFLLGLALAAQVWVGIRWGMAEARFLFPALAAVVFFMVVPMAEVLRRAGRSERFIGIYFAALALYPYLFLGWVGD